MDKETPVESALRIARESREKVLMRIGYSR
jgi:hypothetical protein